MSTPQGGGPRRPFTVSTGATATGGKGKKATAAKPSAGKPTGAGPAGPPRRFTPIKVNQSRNWGPIILFVLVGLLAAGIIGYGGYAVYQNGQGWEDKATAIDGIADYRDNPEAVKRDHQQGGLTYPVNPPVGGVHNNAWQRCLGDVYDAPIASEHAVHSLEHGAVWITYRPDLPADQVEALAARVRGQDYLLMSPYEGLDAPISLQAWGFQLKVDNASDPRIDEFLTTLRVNAGPEQGVSCSAGDYVTATGTTPRDMSQQPAPGGGAGGTGG